MSVFVGICGGTGSGKSTLAARLAEELGPDQASIIQFDSYYQDLTHLPLAKRVNVNFDHMDALDAGLLASHLDTLKSGNEIAIPVYDFTSHTRTKTIQVVEPKPVIIVEGILLFAFNSIRLRLDYLVFRDCPENIRFKRRTDRDLEERSRTLESIETQLSNTVKPMHDMFVQPYRHKADFITRHNHNLEEATARIVNEIDRLSFAPEAQNAEYLELA